MTLCSSIEKQIALDDKFIEWEQKMAKLLAEKSEKPLAAQVLEPKKDEK